MFAYTKIMQALAAAGVVPAATDPYFNLTTLLLNTSSTNGAQNNTFLDSSTNNFTITRNGNTTQGTFTPFSQTGWSNYFGGSGSYAVTDTAIISSTTTTFTIEGWIYPTATPVTGSSIPTLICDGQPAGSLLYWGFGPIANGNLSFYWYDGASKSATGNSVIALNTWTHIAISVSSNAISMYVNGVQQTITGTTTLSNRTGSNNYTAFAQFSNGSSYFTGYISNLSALNGTAKYSSSFTPSTTALPTNTTNQVLLFAYGNRFADVNTATTAKTITVTGTPSVQAFSPFLPTTAYDTAVVGGSGYFDGSGDYLTLGGVAGLAIGTNDFEISLWAYWNSVGTQVLYEGRPGSNGAYPSIASVSSNVLVYFVNSANVITGPTVVANQWYYITVSRVSGTTRMFVNGSQVGSSWADSTNYGTGGTAPWIGAGYAPGDYMNGYISNLRVVIGSGVTSQTVPTAPLTAITNTKLLLSCTNTGIYDSASKNVLETVGNAQVSTTQAKWGTTSMYFDGTGDYLKLPSNAIYAFNTGAYTIEFWIYPNSLAAGAYHVVGANATNGIIIAINNAKIALNKYGVGDVLAYNTALTTSVWTHVAIVREGTGTNQTKIYVNGTSVATGTDSNDWSVTTNFGVGANTSDGSQGINAYLDDLRITKGYARYTSNFTAPTAAFPLQ